MYTSALDEFHFNGDNVEDMRWYKPGGYHPVHLGDMFGVCPNNNQPRYRILHKLGFGAFSTVWFAKDMANNDRGVAMKFTVADPKRNTHETEILEALSRRDKDHPGHSHILQLLDHFKLDGPNGTHDVLVTDILVSLRTLRDLQLLDSKRGSFQVVLGLAYLQQQGIIHGDLHTGNIAFLIPGLNSAKADDLMKLFDDARAIPVLPRRYQGTNHSLPKYVVESADLFDVIKPLVTGMDKDNLCAVITDFGNAVRYPDLIPEPCTPMFVRPPEMIFNNSNADSYDFDWHSRSDVWSLGCSIYEIVTGFPFFYSVGTQQSLIRKMVELLGPFPPHWYNLVDPKPYPEESGASLQAKAETQYQAKFATDSLLTPLVRSMLQYDPAVRPSADEVTNHPWFDDVRPGGVKNT